jgi:hypothetical protein
MITKVDSGQIWLCNGTHIQFPFAIRSVALAGDILVIILNPPANRGDRDQVFGYDLLGHKLWQIEHSANVAGTFTGISETSETKVVVYEFTGVSVEVDRGTGKILKETFVK